MILRPVLTLVTLALAAITTIAHRVEIDPGQRQCYFETLEPQDKVCHVMSYSVKTRGPDGTDEVDDRHVRGRRLDI
jgi:hypothetical protein